MDQPVLLAVDGVDVAGLPRIQCEGSPCRRAALFQQHIEQLWRANVTRLHVLQGDVAAQRRADLLAHQRAAAIAADQELAGNLDLAAVRGGEGRDAFRALREIDQ